ncbi:hypothetical protein [uncultured Tateyamaria sp.]|uniref:hypothetical protein n=1 Tax=uncultured Tateyamaria sp. TaxID=455651 RepID=UPI00260815C4|nr:hypothetical protein [uncultured Tateyamaria sp.]
MFPFNSKPLARLCAATFALLVLSACISPGANEFAVYQASFNQSYQVGQSVLDKLAVAERKAFENARVPITPRTVYFDPGEARYLAPGIDPPATASLRKSLDILNTYTQTVSGLATGESATTLANRLTQIGTQATSLGARIVAPVGPGQRAVIDSLATRAQPLRALEPATTAAFGVLTRAEFQKTVVEQAPTIDAIFDKLIALTGTTAAPGAGGKISTDPKRACFEAATTSIFCVLIGDLLFDRDTISGLRGFSQAEVARIEGLQVLLANWVVLLENTRVALAHSVDAIENRQSRANSASILQTIAEMDAAAQGVRAALAAQ